MNIDNYYVVADNLYIEYVENIEYRIGDLSGE